MFTVALTLIGIIVFFVSLFGAGFKAGFRRLATLTIVGIVLDVITFIAVMIATYISL